MQDEIDTKGNSITEYEGTVKLTSFRAEQDLYKGDSFDCILGTGSNGAIIHYKPEEGTSSVLNPDEVILCDSGGQYLDGTTDTTRTIHFRTPTDY